MTTISLPTSARIHPHLRPLNILKDLTSVADLIELCFSSTMDNDGRRYVQDMRKAGYENSFLKWANRAAESTSLPLTGYVWEEDDKIIGNVSLVPFRHQKEKIYLIANVATHPSHRGRGIARALTERAIEHAREKKVTEIWLHVRDDNPTAQRIYTELGFVERARRTSWSAATDAHAQIPQTEIQLAKRNPRDWETHRAWLAQLYPEFLAWHRNWNFDSLKPGFWNWLYYFSMDVNIYQWTAYKESKMQSALAWIPDGRGEALFAAIGERSDSAALTTLLIQARRDLFNLYPRISLEFPAGEFDAAIRDAGFTVNRTLIWMQATL